MYVEMGCLAIALVSFTVIFISIIWQICRILFWRPYVVTKCFRKQGIRGPPYSVLSGSLHEIERLKNAARGSVLETSSNDIIQRVVPHYHRWSLDYGLFLSLYMSLSLTRIILNQFMDIFVEQTKLWYHLFSMWKLWYYLLDQHKFQ